VLAYGCLKGLFEVVYTVVTKLSIVLHRYYYTSLLTHSQLLEGFKCESQTKNNGRIRSRGMLPGSQHFGGVEGCAGAPRWD